jgi:peptide-methionine (S)-S-oxide reductase
MKTQAVTLMAACVVVATISASAFPDPLKDIRTTAPAQPQTAVLAGGCFWGVVSGYAGGSQLTAHYSVVSSGVTSHAESVQIKYDPVKISYGQLLKVFFAVAHDPTELNRQGPDEGPQYRSSIFYGNEEQKEVAEAYVSQLNGAHVFSRPVVTTVVPLKGFYQAEDYHQNFLARNPNNRYIVVNDLPKLRALKSEFPELLKAAPAAKKK